jgi:hypothetical protein
VVLAPNPTVPLEAVPLFFPQIPVKGCPGDIQIPADVLHRCLPVLVKLPGEGDFAGSAGKLGTSTLSTCSGSQLYAARRALIAHVGVIWSETERKQNGGGLSNCTGAARPLRSVLSPGTAASGAGMRISDERSRY